MRLNPLLILLLAAAACNASTYSQISDEELHAKAVRLPLPERYDFYVEVLHSSLPSRPVIAEDVAALGPSAWEYVVDRAVSKGPAELSQAIPVLYAFKKRCSTTELEKLNAHAERVASADMATSLKSSIDSMCGGGVPAGD